MVFGIETSQIASGMNIVYWGFLGLLIVGGIAAIIMFVMLMMRYNKIVEIRIKNGKSFVVVHDNCMEQIDEAGNKYWVRWKERDKQLKFMPAPPSSAIGINRKGKDCATVKLIDGHYIWLEDEDNVAAIPENLFVDMPEDIKNLEDVEVKIKKTMSWKKDKLQQWMEANNIHVAFHPFTATERAILVNAIHRAEERKMKGWQSQLPMIVGVGAAIIVLICLLVFYGNIAKPVLEMADKQAAWQTAQTEQLKIIQEIKQDIQRLEPVSSTKTAPGGK